MGGIYTFVAAPSSASLSGVVNISCVCVDMVSGGVKIVLQGVGTNTEFSMRVVTSGSNEPPKPSANGERCVEGRFRHLPFRKGRQSTHNEPDLAHEQFAQRPLPLHRQHTGMVLRLSLRTSLFLLQSYVRNIMIFIFVTKLRT